MAPNRYIEKNPIKYDSGITKQAIKMNDNVKYYYFRDDRSIEISIL